MLRDSCCWGLYKELNVFSLESNLTGSGRRATFCLLSISTARWWCDFSTSRGLNQLVTDFTLRSKAKAAISRIDFKAKSNATSANEDSTIPHTSQFFTNITKLFMSIEVAGQPRRLRPDPSSYRTTSQPFERRLENHWTSGLEYRNKMCIDIHELARLWRESLQLCFSRSTTRNSYYRRVRTHKSCETQTYNFDRVDPT